MDISSPTQAAEVLRAHGIRPQKKLGQNFLCDATILTKIADAANLTDKSAVLEIGPGMGALTQILAAKAGKVTSIEIDEGMRRILHASLRTFPNVEVRYADFLKLYLDDLLSEIFPDSSGTVVSNIPYYITTRIMQLLIKHKQHLDRVVLLVQKEFAQRLVAKPGDDACGALSLFVQYHAEVSYIATVSRNVFLPIPAVDSAIVALQISKLGRVKVGNETRLFQIIHAAFVQRRKTLLNALLRAPESYGLGMSKETRVEAEALLERIGIDGTRRGETLSLQEFALISDAFDELLGNSITDDVTFVE